MTGSRRLSQAISEGDGISVIAIVVDAAGASAAEAEGADAIAVEGPVPGVREATALPVLSLASAGEGDADAGLLVARDEDDELEQRLAELVARGLECVVDVRDEEELELVLERIDPEILLLSPREADDGEEPIDRVLELLPDVPAGKLAVAELRSTTREEIAALERAGVDAVLVGTGSIAELVGEPTPEV